MAYKIGLRTGNLPRGMEQHGTVIVKNGKKTLATDRSPVKIERAYLAQLREEHGDGAVRMALKARKDGNKKNFSKLVEEVAKKRDAVKTGESHSKKVRRQKIKRGKEQLKNTLVGPDREKIADRGVANDDFGPR